MRNEKQDKEIGERLEVTRLALGYPKQTDFAEAISQVMPMSVQRWNAYECGREGLPWRVALALYAKFDLSLDWIYAGKRGSLSRDLNDKLDAVLAARK